ncbi:MAG: hypothetical protein COA83_01955 [Methylophaga sp.]|nr:MAG: hypothetical protein COA83_01955 [Methylophaga sp.]
MIRFSNKASRDLDAILDYSIINFGLAVTVDYHTTLETCFETLDTNPDLGTRVEHIRSDYLCFEHRSHLIFYKKNDDDIFIVRIIHKSMDVQTHIS